MTLEAKHYTPRAGSLAASVIAFFRKHPEEELHISDIALKFDTPKESIHAALKEAVNLDILKRNNTLYCTGAAIGDSAAIDSTGAAPGKAAKPAPSGYNSARLGIDFSSPKVDSDVPYVPNGSGGASKWAPLFDKLTEPNQSIAVPARVKAALAAAAIKRNKEKRGTFKVAIVSATEARIWRIA